MNRDDWHDLASVFRAGALQYRDDDRVSDTKAWNAAALQCDKIASRHAGRSMMATPETPAEATSVNVSVGDVIRCPAGDREYDHDMSFAVMDIIDAYGGIIELRGLIDDNVSCFRHWSELTHWERTGRSMGESWVMRHTRQ